MFDANMRHLPKGMMFFAKIESIKLDCELFNLGARRNDIIKCEMLDECHDDPRVRFFISSKEHVFEHRNHWRQFWAVYAGQIDGGDFINDEDRAKAMAVMEGEQ